MNDFEEVKNHVLIADVISEVTGLEIKKAGPVTFTLSECFNCHGHGCFQINTKGQYYKCFQCEEKGDVFTFFQHYQRLGSRYEALKALAVKINYALQSSKEGIAHSRIQEMKSLAADYYHDNLLSRQKNQPIQCKNGNEKSFLASTVLGYQKEVRKHHIGALRKNNVGYADGGLLDYLTAKGFKKREIQKTGLLNAAGKDLFRDTYVYPHHVNGEVSHFTQKDPKGIQKHQVKKEFRDKKWFAFNQDALTFADEVIIVEGENDLISVVGKAEREDVIALIGNISHEQLGTMKPFLKGKTAFLCFDQDATGKKYEQIILEHCLGDEYDIRLMKFEGAKDIDELLNSSADPKKAFTSLISSAVKPPDIMSRIEFRKGRYFISRGNRTVPISNFTINIKNRFVSNGNSVREVAFVDVHGNETRPFILEPAQMVTPSKFKEFCLSKGNFVYEGTGVDLAEIWKYEMAKDRGKKIIQPDHLGYLPEHNLWLFGNVLMKDGRAISSDEDGVFWIGNTGFKPAPLSLSGGSTALPELRSESVEEARDLLAFIVPKLRENIGQHGSSLAIGWIKACIYSREIFQRFKFFPFLFLYGKFQCGKNTFARTLLSFFGLGDTEGDNISESTQTGISRKLSFYSCIATWFDEFRNEPKILKLCSFLRNIYNRVGAVKGIKSEFGTRSVPIRGALLLSGEQEPSDPGLRSRSIPIVLRRDQRKDSVFQEINPVLPRLSSITAMWIQEKTAKSVEELLGNIGVIKRRLQVEHGFDARLAENYAVAIAAFYSIAPKEEFEKFYDWAVQAASSDKDAKDEDHVLQQFIDDMEALIRKKEIPSNYFQADEATEEVKIYFRGIYNLWAKDYRQRVGVEPFPKRAILDHFKEEPYFIKDDRPYIHGTQMRGLILDLKTAPKDLVAAMRNHTSQPV